MSHAEASGGEPQASLPPRYAELYARLSDDDRQQALEPADLETLALAAYMVGRAAESVAYLARAHQEHLARGAAARAVRCAFWLFFVLSHEGEWVQAAGWVSRGRRLLDECEAECVERGYLLLPEGLQKVAAGDIQAAGRIFAEAARIGDRFRDADLASLGRQGHGRALINQGLIAEGGALLDEVMVAVTGGEVSPIVAGTVYCGVIEACFEMFDLRRARDWTDALSRWCVSHPDVVPYRGLCQVRRAEMMVLHGAWPEATSEARQVCQPSAERSSMAAVGPGLYQLAEVHRLRGEFSQADEAYRRASESGRNPYPGLALLRLAEGKVDAARAAICRVTDEARDRKNRVRCLAACVEILLASSDVGAAREAAGQLTALAATLATPYPRALAAQARGAVLLTAGDAAPALGELRDGCTTWRELDMPYEAARAGVLVALACRALGDVDGARLELEAARAVFDRLGATPDRARADALLADLEPAPSPGSGLTIREVEVLRLVATGKTNRAIAQALAISEKTVARHLSNIFTKLDLPSRAAATAYAYEHDLL